MVLTAPYVPETIVVHLGYPSAPARNVTVAFLDYIKNVASSEVYRSEEHTSELQSLA